MGASCARATIGSTLVKLGPEHGLNRESSVHRDELVSLPKEVHALAIALDLNEEQTGRTNVPALVFLFVDRDLKGAKELLIL